MTAGWATVVAIVALGVAVFVRGMVKGAVQFAREGTRRDRVALPMSARRGGELVAHEAEKAEEDPPRS